MAGTTISQFDKERIPDILAGYGGWFSAMLIRLIKKADTNNRELLRQVYPDHVEAFEDWYYSRGFYDYPQEAD